MSDEAKGGLDALGVGEVAKAIPPAAWEKLVTTACDTFIAVVSPITAITSGTGRWLTAKFDRMEGLEKINTAAVFEKAKIEIEARHALPPPKATKPSDFKVVANAVEQLSREGDPDLQSLWANLLATELTTGGVHPLFPDIMSKLTAADAKRLSEIAGSTRNSYYFLMKSMATRVAESGGFPVNFKLLRSQSWKIGPNPNALPDSALQALGLIDKSDSEDPWSLTALGQAFVEVVTSPVKNGPSPTSQKTPAPSAQTDPPDSPPSPPSR